MPAPRDVLEHLKRDELIAAVDRLGLAVGDRRRRDLLSAALAAVPAPELAGYLSDLKRERLKELCRVLGLDDGGPKKAALVDRLLGAAPPAPPAPPSPAAAPPPPARAATRSAPAGEHAVVDQGGGATRSPKPSSTAFPRATSPTASKKTPTAFSSAPTNSKPATTSRCSTPCMSTRC